MPKRHVGGSMSFDIKLLNGKDEKGWDSFVMRNDDATFYHQVGWKSVIEKTYGHRPYYLFAKNDNGDIVGIFPIFLIKNILFGKRLISIPFAPYGGMCCENEDISKELLNEALHIGKNLNVDFCEFRNLKNNNIYNYSKYMNDYSTFILTLSNGADYIWKNMNKKVRNMIRKGEKNSLKFETETNCDMISKFFELYSKNMKHLGTPTHGQEFFGNIYKIFARDVVISSVTLNEDIVSSIYMLKFKDTIISGWASSLEEYLKYAPNDFIYWNSIKYAYKNNFRKFDFGRSLVNSDASTFKVRWGCVEVKLTYCYYPSTKTLLTPQSEYGKFSKIWKKLPYGITKIIGPEIRRYIP